MPWMTAEVFTEVFFYNPSGDSISQESEGECARMVQGMNVRFRVR